ncbi:hypothetical protein SAMN04488011_101549 [Palleronia pelagia]|uniref:Uncharacterized protein n=1 Tax=Palleronia pelagia TaxID=387096 RepID=A0A1H8BFL2_9RHOB|nr:hypothetical protein SAMN04488011_101549 [Palleronia pelagia]
MIARYAVVLLNAFVLGALLLFAAEAKAGIGHGDDLTVAAHLTASTDAHAGDHTHDDRIDHCHPGLDCFSPVVFSLRVGVHPPEAVTAADYLSTCHAYDGISPGLDVPPPRLRA